MDAMIADDAVAAEAGRYARLLGDRLRGLRQQQDLSLLDVQERSAGEFKASVLGAYERGERAVSMARLHRLADFYHVPVTELLPQVGALDVARQARADADASGKIVIDLLALEERREEEPELFRYVASLQSRRGDYNGRVLTVRSADLDTLSAILDDGPGPLRSRLTASGIIR